MKNLSTPALFLYSFPILLWIVSDVSHAFPQHSVVRVMHTGSTTDWSTNDLHRIPIRHHEGRALPNACTSRLEGKAQDQEESGRPKKNFIANFFEELDNFVDDATSRRLGAGQAFYGKRKSSFYGEEDKGRKKNPFAPDPTEDYQGPRTAGYFKWMKDEDTGRMVPVTRLKEKNIERNPSFWDRIYDDNGRKE